MLSGPLRRVGPGQQLIEAIEGMARDNAGEDVGEKSLRIDAVEFAGLDQRSEVGPMLAAAVGADKERVLAIERDRPDGTLDGIGIDP